MKVLTFNRTNFRLTKSICGLVLLHSKTAETAQIEIDTAITLANIAAVFHTLSKFKSKLNLTFSLNYNFSTNLESDYLKRTQNQHPLKLADVIHYLSVCSIKR